MLAAKWKRGLVLGALLAAMSSCGGPGGAPDQPTPHRVAPRREAIGIPYDRFVLIKDHGRVVALRVTAASVLGDTVTYEWYGPSDSGRSFEQASSGRGTAQEALRTGTIFAGPIRLDWSRGSPSFGWIYWPAEDSEFAICSRAWGTLEDVDPAARGARWYTQRMFN